MLNDEQINEVMRLSDEVSGAVGELACSTNESETYESIDAARAALKAYLSTIGEPESVNAELLEALKGMVDAHAIPSSYCKERSVYDQARAAIARAESAVESSPKPVTFLAMKAAFRTTRVEAGEFIMAFKFRDIEDMDRADDEWRAAMAIETPAKVSPCAGHAVQQEADEAIGLAQALEQHRARKIVDAVSALPVGGKHEDSPSPFHAGYQLACDEVMHRLLTEEWDGCLTPPGKQEDDEAGGA